jgi:phage terminase large subunit-like protein
MAAVRQSFLASFEEFSAEHLRHYVGRWKGRPVTLEEFQRDIFDEALAVDERGDWLWEKVAIVVPRKNGKTTMLAAYAVWRLLVADDYPEILLAAASDRNAGRLFNNCAAFIRQSPTLSRLCRVRDHAGEIVREDGMGIIIRLSSDPGKLLGYNPSDVIADEVGEWTTPSLKRVYDALTTGGGAREGQAHLFTISTAGYSNDRENGILGGILDTARAAGDVTETPGLAVMKNEQAKTLVWAYEAPTVDRFDTAAVKLANPATWITEEYLAKQAHSDLTDAAFLRYHACVWAASVSAWLPTGAWAARKSRSREGWPDEDTEVVIGFDGSYDNDSTALVGCTLEDDPYVFVVDVWERPEDAVKGWVVPRDEVDVAVDGAMARWRVRELACDPPGWHREIEEWGQRYGSTVTLMFPTNRRKLMSEASSRFYTAVVNGELEHDGNRDLARHLANAVVKEYVEPGGAGAYITKEHRASPKKIDLAVAAVIAFYRASQEHLSGDIVYDFAALLDR